MKGTTQLAEPVEVGRKAGNSKQRNRSLQPPPASSAPEVTTKNKTKSRTRTLKIRIFKIFSSCHFSPCLSLQRSSLTGLLTSLPARVLNGGTKLGASGRNGTGANGTTGTLGTSGTGGGAGNHMKAGLTRSTETEDSLDPIRRRNDFGDLVTTRYGPS